MKYTKEEFISQFILGIYRYNSAFIMLLIFKICIINYLLFNVYGINSSFYKVALTQKDYAQFLEYDVEVPTISEFTFCLWLRVLNLDHDQTIFSYIGESNMNIINVWLEAGGTNLKMSINKNVYSTVSVDWQIGTWQHLCVSFQSELGAWAIYADGILVSCDASRNLLGFVIPGDGNIIIGHMNPINGLENGLEGDIYGFNLVLKSTIEKQYLFKKVKPIIQKLAKDKNKKNKEKFKYIVLGDLDTAKTDEILHESSNTETSSAKKNHIHFATPYSVIDHDVGKLTTLIQNDRNVDSSREKEIFDIPTLNNENSNFKYPNSNIWNVINKAGNTGKFKKDNINPILPAVNLATIKYNNPSINSNTPEISIFETPPPPGIKNQYFNNDNPNMENFNKKNVFSIKESKLNDKLTGLLDVETPPPISKDNVFKQRESMRFANNVLNFIKQSNKKSKNLREVPATIPLIKVSDSFPYTSNMNTKTSQFKSNYVQRKYNLKKRDIGRKEKNLKIEYFDLRADIINSHAKTEPKDVTVTYRGDPLKEMDVRTSRNINKEELINQQPNKFNGNLLPPKPFMPSNHKINPIVYFNRSILNKSPNNSKLMVAHIYKDMYIRSLNKDNKWHNSNFKSIDYPVRSMEIKKNLNKYSSIKMADNNVIEQNDNKETNNDITKARQFAIKIAKLTDLKNKSTDNFKVTETANNFDKHIKIGYALDERNIIGQSQIENKLSFLGGDDRIPDINHYRSDIDGVNTIKTSIPPSLRFKTCSNAVINDNNTSAANEFVFENYYSCSIGKNNKSNQLVLINWIETPVRLFGGAKPKRL